MKSNGEVGYTAYRAFSKGLSLATKQPIPEWEGLSAEIKDAWNAACDAVTKNLIQNMPKSANSGPTEETKEAYHQEMALLAVECGLDCNKAHKVVSAFMDKAFGLDTSTCLS